MNFTLPSHMPTFTPPGWRLRAEMSMPDVADCPFGSHGGFEEMDRTQ